jgi:hypothetical protein
MSVLFVVSTGTCARAANVEMQKRNTNKILFIIYISKILVFCLKADRRKWDK